MKNNIVPNQVFLTYVKKDNAIARLLAKRLRDEGYLVSSDESAENESKNRKENKKALDESAYMIAILSEFSFSSSYVRGELEHAFFSDQYKNKLLPVLLDPTSDTDFKRLPWILQRMEYLHIKGKHPKEAIVDKIAVAFIELVNRREAES